MANIIQSNQVENLIIAIRGERVILDSDVAALYGVETREINQAVKNNPDKFPEGYVLSLETKEKEEVIKIFDNLQKLKFSPSIKAFTEKGLYMLATLSEPEFSGFSRFSEFCNDGCYSVNSGNSVNSGSDNYFKRRRK